MSRDRRWSCLFSHVFPWRSRNLAQKCPNRPCLTIYWFEWHQMPRIASNDYSNWWQGQWDPFVSLELSGLTPLEWGLYSFPQSLWLCREEWTPEQSQGLPGRESKQMLGSLGPLEYQVCPRPLSLVLLFRPDDTLSEILPHRLFYFFTER